MANPQEKQSRIVRILGGERGIGVLLPILIAVMLIGLGIHFYGRFLHLDACGHDTMATIIEKNTIFDNSARSGQTRYEMIVGFTVGDIMRRGSVQVTSSYYDGHKPGQRVPIQYLPDDPQVREIDPDRRGKFIREGVVIILILLAMSLYNYLNMKPARSQ